MKRDFKTYRLYDPKNSEPFRISRSKIDLFLNCPRCFYLDVRLGIKRPDFPAFTLNNAVDVLLKKEFDLHRSAKTPHPLMKSYGLDAVPFDDPRMDEWRDALRRGVYFLHQKTNLIVRGGIDDVWINKRGELIIVDYKATSKESEITLDDPWKEAYKRQLEVYQWLFHQNGFRVNPVGYFVFVNGKTDRKAFDGKLEFDVILLEYKGATDWIEPTIIEIKKTLDNPTAPKANTNCEYCRYVEARALATSRKKDPPTGKIKTTKNEALF